MQQKAAVRRSVLRWAGSKRQLIPKLMAVVPNDVARYVEPFAGSAALFFALQPNQALLADFNPALINALNYIRRNPVRIRHDVGAIPRTRAAYNEVREEYGHYERGHGAAVRFIYLNRNCFNALYRTNRRGDFNVPFGERTGELPSVEQFVDASRALAQATLRTWDFGRTVASLRRGDLAYIDPPYYSGNRGTYGEYGYGAFDDTDFEALISGLRSASRRGATILMSYKDTSTLREALPNWSVATVGVRRHVAGQPRNRSSTTEVIASNSLDLHAISGRHSLAVNVP